MGRNLEIKDILLEKDFEKLKGQLVTLGIIMEDDYESVSDLYDNRENICANTDAYNVIKEHIFAGKTSAKYWTIPSLREIDNKNEFKEQIENLSIYNKNILASLENGIKEQNILAPTPYTCIKLEEGKYLIRVITPSGNKKIDNGINKVSQKQYKNVVCYIDIEYKYLEIRAEATVAEKIKKYFEIKLNFNGITPIKILNRYSNNLESFKDSFENAKFTNLKSIPEFDSDLSDDELEHLVKMLVAIDGYVINKDEDALIEEIRSIDIEENEAGFIPLLLAGLSNIGISTNNSHGRDITNQPMYKIIERYLSHQSGIIIIYKGSDESYSIQVGMKTDSIVFLRNITSEKNMREIRNKILGIEI